MRLLYVVSLFPCWSETFIVREITHLLERGIDVHIVSLKRASESLVQPDAARLLSRVRYPLATPAAVAAVLHSAVTNPRRTVLEILRIVTGLIRRPAALGKTLVVWWRTLALIETVRTLQPDHIHAHWATYPSTAAMLMAGRLGVPFSFTCHAHDIFVNDQLVAAKLQQAAFVVTISEFNRAWLKQRYAPARTGRLEVVRCGLRLDEYRLSDGRREPGLIVGVGRLDPIKGFRHLVDACAQLKADGTAFRCVIVGAGPLYDALDAQIRRLGLERECRLTGALAQEEVRALMQRASVFVLPSVVTAAGDRDGIPVALMEAMAVGTPVVSTPVSGIPELIEDQVNGLLAVPGDARSLACQIRQILAEPPAAAAMAARARGRVESGFDVAKEADRLLQLMREGATSR